MMIYDLKTSLRSIGRGGVNDQSSFLACQQLFRIPATLPREVEIDYLYSTFLCWKNWITINIMLRMIQKIHIQQQSAKWKFERTLHKPVVYFHYLVTREIKCYYPLLIQYFLSATPLFWQARKFRLRFASMLQDLRTLLRSFYIERSYWEQFLPFLNTCALPIPNFSFYPENLMVTIHYRGYCIKYFTKKNIVSA